jgi:hypothetical protein
MNKILGLTFVSSTDEQLKTKIVIIKK